MRVKVEGRSSRSPSDREAIFKCSRYDTGMYGSDWTCWRRAIVGWLRWTMEVMHVAVPKFVGVVVGGPSVSRSSKSQLRLVPLTTTRDGHLDHN